MGNAVKYIINLITRIVYITSLLMTMLYMYRSVFLKVRGKLIEEILAINFFFWVGKKKSPTHNFLVAFKNLGLLLHRVRIWGPLY